MQAVFEVQISDFEASGTYCFANPGLFLIV